MQELGDNDEEQANQRALDDLTGKRNLYSFPLLSPLERDVLAFQKVMGLRDKAKKKSKKTKKKRKGLASSSRSQRTAESAESSKVNVHDEVCHNRTEIRPASVMQNTTEQKRWTYSNGSSELQVKTAQSGWLDLNELKQQSQDLPEQNALGLSKLAVTKLLFDHIVLETANGNSRTYEDVIMWYMETRESRPHFAKHAEELEEKDYFSLRWHDCKRLFEART